MLIKEYRVTLPLSVEEYQRGQLFSIAEASKNETGGGEGVEVVKNEPFCNQPLLGCNFHTGQYTYKIYHLQSKIPGFVRMLLPKEALCLHEEAWNAYPYCRTIITNPYMKDRFSIIIETYHLDDKGVSNNVHQLSQEKLDQREVVQIDIANDPVTSADYNKDEDPAIFQSVTTNRGPLGKTWMDEANPVMTCYKLVTVEFRWFGLQTRIENFLHRCERRLFLMFHRQLFCWIDRWYSLTLADIRAIEEKTKEELDRRRREGSVRGMRAED